LTTERGISEIFGEGSDAGGRPTPIYRALRALLCSACGTPMPAGSLFTRISIPHFALRILPRCQRCAPFEVRSEGQDAPKSSLINNLLSPPEEPKAATAEPPRDARQEVAKRLGPALSRSRRSK
jgi:hypothetical protein